MASDVRAPVALVTGGAGGLGIAVARALAASGRRVTLLDRDGIALEKAARLLALPGPHPTAEVSDRGSFARALREVEAEAGPVRTLVHAAGIAESRPLLPPDDELWDRTMAVNARGAWVAATACLEGMLAAREGGIVLVASTAGLRAYRYTAAYCASKHAVVGLARALAEDLRGKGISVNAVCPGFMDTPMTDRTVAAIVASTGRSEAEARATIAAMNSSGRLVAPEEVAGVVVGLLGDPARTGEAVTVA
jgi:NAD(P)-dependent dehydrogenase (short-subunit alcohol dehydrogenase family)